MNSSKPIHTCCELGVLGLGLLSRNVILQIARQGHSVGAWDPDFDRCEKLRADATGLPVVVARSIADFTTFLCRPRAIMMLIPGGPHLETVFHQLIQGLEPGDLILDTASYHHVFTPRKQKLFAESGIHYVPAGIASSGQGHEMRCSVLYPKLIETCQRIRPIFGTGLKEVREPCVSFIGKQVDSRLQVLVQGTLDN